MDGSYQEKRGVEAETMVMTTWTRTDCSSSDCSSKLGWRRLAPVEDGLLDLLPEKIRRDVREVRTVEAYRRVGLRGAMHARAHRSSKQTAAAVAHGGGGLWAASRRSG